MGTKAVSVFIVVLVATLLFSIMPFPAQAASGSYTQVFTTSTSDGYTYNTNPTYSTARTAATGSIGVESTTMKIGQKTSYFLYRGAVYFDTSSLPDSATVTAAVLSVYVESDSSATDFSLTLQTGGATYPHDPLVVGDYLYSLYSGDGGSASTSGISGVGFFNVTLSSTGRGWISKTGGTKFCLRSSRDISGTQPSGDEYITVYTAEQGVTYAARLYVTYSISSTCLYDIHGPYVDSPVAVYEGTVEVQVFSNASESITYTLNGALGIADTLVLTPASPLLLLTFNISSLGNYTRTITFSSSAESVYLFIPSPNTPFDLYTFTLFDMQGITTGYLATRIYFNGAYRTVECQPIGVINAVPFYMQWACVYDLRITCDQGTIDEGSFTALGVTDNNLILPYGSIPIAESGLPLTVNALRMNSTWIQMNCSDPDSLLSWVYIRIDHNVKGTYRTDYTDNTTDQTVQVNWYTALGNVSYRVTVMVLRDGEVYTFTFTCASVMDENNPWSDALGDYAPALAVCLTIAAGCVFSYATISGGAWVMVGFAAFFAYIGWLPQTTATYGVIAFGGLVSSLITIAEWKKTEREL